MPPIWTFTFGLVVLILFGWYIATDLGDRKLVAGTILSLMLIGFCAVSVYPPKDRISLGLDLRGGTSFLIRLVVPEERESKVITPTMLDQAVEVIRSRVDKFGGGEPVITPQGTDRILVQIPGLEAEKIDEARNQLEQVAKLEFYEVDPESAAKIAKITGGEAIIPPDSRIAVDDEQLPNGKKIDEKLLIKKRPVLTGNHVYRASFAFGQDGNGVALELDSQGAKVFDDFASTHVGQRFAIVLDGKIQSAPNLREAHYGGNARITGNFTEAQARNLASVLVNPLETPVKIEETRSASSTLGADSIRSGVMAGVGGLILVLIVVAIYYQFAGLVAILGLLVNIVLLFGALAMFNFVLTLPGIAGIILTIGLAVDANVLIYERLREEMAHGKSLAAAIDSAYDKAFTVIFDANATTLITAAILFWAASGPIKGFAVSLTIGIIASVFSAMIVTRTCFGWALKTGLLKRVTMFHILSGKTIDFLGKRFLWIGISLTIIAISVAGFVIRGDKNFGIDFKGGDLLMIEATGQSVSEGDVRKAIESLGIPEAVVQKEREPAVNKDYIAIRSPFDTSEKIEQYLMKTMPQAGFTEHQRDKVGTLVGGEMAKTSLMALGLGMLGILVYVTIRFEFSFALGALVALLHDVIITTGVFAICGRELSLIMVGAILTIAGYSINDTIVVYDRIREGLRSGRKGSIQDIMNASINETLSRTILTSSFTFLSVAALFFFGGPVLNDFAFAILIGIVVGTYSSIFIASPIVLWWSGRKGGQTLRREVTAPAGA